MKIRRITATVDFDPEDGYLPNREEAIQSLLESVSDDGGDFTIEYATSYDEGRAEEAARELGLD